MSSHGGLREPLVGDRKEEKGSWLKRNGLFVVGYVTLLGLLVTFVALYAYEKNKSHNHKKSSTSLNAHVTTCNSLCGLRCVGSDGAECWKPCVAGCVGDESTSVSASSSSLIGDQLEADAVSHLGITVEDLDVAVQWYVQLMGGALVSADFDEYSGDELQQIVFQREILQAADGNKTWDQMQIPDIASEEYTTRSAQVNFGNMQLELNEFRNADKTHFEPLRTTPSVVPHLHICWRLNPWASMESFLDKFERESWNAGFSNVRCNRVVHANNDTQRHAIGQLDTYNSFFVANGSFEGWRLAYCKGPSGEQFEFSQETHAADLDFAAANSAYLASKKEYSANAAKLDTCEEHSYTHQLCTTECYMTCIGKKPKHCIEPCYDNCVVGGYWNTSKSVLGADLRLHAVQHIGITVADLSRTTRFYTEVLGGIEAENAGGDGWTGDAVNNALFQKELLEAKDKGVDSTELDVAQFEEGGPDILAARYITFGSLYLELLMYHPKPGREADSQMPAFAETTSQGYVTNMHMALKLKAEVDLNQFAADFEKKCQEMGYKNVRCHVTVAVESEEQRASLLQEAGDANSYTVSDGTFAGNEMAVCKGPEGEQFEFIQEKSDSGNAAIAKAMHKYVGEKQQWGPIGDNDVPLW